MVHKPSAHAGQADIVENFSANLRPLAWDRRRDARGMGFSGRIGPPASRSASSVVAGGRQQPFGLEIANERLILSDYLIKDVFAGKHSDHLLAIQDRQMADAPFAHHPVIDA